MEGRVVYFTVNKNIIQESGKKTYDNSSCHFCLLVYHIKSSYFATQVLIINLHIHSQYLIQKFKLSYPLWFLKCSQLLLTQGFNLFKWIKPIQFINLNVNELWVLAPVERATSRTEGERTLELDRPGVEFLTLPFTSCMTLNRLFNFFELQYYYLHNVDERLTWLCCSLKLK